MTTATKHYWSFNYFDVELTTEQVESCSHQGECYYDCKDVLKEIGTLGIPKTKMIKELIEYGAWSLSELKAMDKQELEIKLIWIAAGNIKDDLFERGVK